MNEHVFRKPAFFIHLFFSGPMVGVSAARDSNGNAVDVLRLPSRAELPEDEASGHGRLRVCGDERKSAYTPKILRPIPFREGILDRGQRTPFATFLTHRYIIPLPSKGPIWDAGRWEG
jgi:hypothetical protein